MLSGSIDLIVQSETFAQNASGITVTGNLLDEGAASAYYSSVTGSINNSNAGAGSPDYVGEIDPNSPSPLYRNDTIPGGKHWLDAQRHDPRRL